MQYKLFGIENKIELWKELENLYNKTNELSAKIKQLKQMNEVHEDDLAYMKEIRRGLGINHL